MVHRSKWRITADGRECSRCGIFKSWDNFTNNKRGTRGRQSWCRDCFREHTGARKKKEYLINETGRECSECGQFKLWPEFHKRKDLSTGHASHCKTCRKKRTRLDTENGSIRNRELKRQYGITLDGYYKLLKSQDDGCAICGATESGVRQNGVVLYLSVDHNHETGEIRGLLCQKCNAMLGMANDDPVILRTAIEYLCKTPSM